MCPLCFLASIGVDLESPLGSFQIHNRRVDNTFLLSAAREVLDSVDHLLVRWDQLSDYHVEFLLNGLSLRENEANPLDLFFDGFVALGR